MIEQLLRDEIDQNPQFFDVALSKEDKDHLINISKSIINTRDKTGPEGGSLVQAIVNNDLARALSSADSICSKSLKFLIHVKMHVNSSVESQLRSIYSRAKIIFESKMNWEEKYDLIFSDEISMAVFKLIHLNYYDPDTSEQEDVTAFMRAFKDKISDL